MADAVYATGQVICHLPEQIESSSVIDGTLYARGVSGRCYRVEASGEWSEVVLDD